MRIRCYLAMTCAEFSATAEVGAPIAWMACHFSCYGAGLSNLPPKLPKGSVVIVNDRTPPHGHDMDTVLLQLQRIEKEQEDISFLFDFQRPGDRELTQLVSCLDQALSRPFAVSEGYAENTGCAVFIQAPPPHLSLKNRITGYQGREIWLELALETEKATVSNDGCQFSLLADTALKEPVFYNTELICRYHTDIFSQHAEFTMQRGKEEINALLQEAEALKIQTAVGLYQQLGSSFSETCRQKTPEA